MVCKLPLGFRKSFNYFHGLGGIRELWSVQDSGVRYGDPRRKYNERIRIAANGMRYIGYRDEHKAYSNDCSCWAGMRDVERRRQSQSIGYSRWTSSAVRREILQLH